MKMNNILCVPNMKNMREKHFNINGGISKYCHKHM